MTIRYLWEIFSGMEGMVSRISINFHRAKHVGGALLICGRGWGRGSPLLSCHPHQQSCTWLRLCPLLLSWPLSPANPHASVIAGLGPRGGSWFKSAPIHPTDATSSPQEASTESHSPLNYDLNGNTTEANDGDWEISPFQIRLPSSGKWL